MEELTVRSIAENRELGDTVGERTITKEYIVYEGEYKTSLTSLSLYGDFYYFLFSNNTGAIHFYPEYKMKEEYKPQINLGFGFLVTYKNKDKNVINAEVYYNLIDIENKNDSDIDFFKRSQFGIRFTFPIVFGNKY